MRTLHAHDDGSDLNPLDMLEQIVSSHDWPFERSSSEELTATIAGNWCEYHLHFSYITEQRALQMVCAFDFRVPEAKRAGMYELLSHVNAQVWLGHFDFLPEEGLLLFRHVLLCSGDEGWHSLHCETMLEVAIHECERFFPSFQFLLWGGKSPQDALAAALIETVGEA